MPKGVYQRTPEQISAMRERLKIGLLKRWTPEARINAREMSIGYKNPFFGKTHSVATRDKMSNAKKGRKMPWRSELGRIKFMYDNPAKLDHVRKVLSLQKKGDRNPQWRGGVTSVNMAIRNSLEYKEWRRRVYERDNYTCVQCGDNKSGNLNADHIKPFSVYPELRFDLNNGRTLCFDCHSKTETFGRNFSFLVKKKQQAQQ